MKFAPYLASMLLALAGGTSNAAPNQQSAAAELHHGGKPGAAVEVLLQSNGKTISGATLPLQLEFRTYRANTTLVVEYRTEGGLALQSASRSRLTTNADGIASDTPTVRALTDGAHYLNVFVTRGKRSRAVSIPVMVGNTLPAPKAAGQATTTPQGENLIILPAADGKR
ncbi:MAG TPA: hypothetical protein VL051_07880 [Burkholderiaceae bacterium]|nr:hypothetical protein [Burkholderiaceae bacterium]